MLWGGYNKERELYVKRPTVFREQSDIAKSKI